ncbi:unnamed protein product [Ectocarpus sp. 8 AP-2014]
MGRMSGGFAPLAESVLTRGALRHNCVRAVTLYRTLDSSPNSRVSSRRLLCVFMECCRVIPSPPPLSRTHLSYSPTKKKVRHKSFPLACAPPRWRTNRFEDFPTAVTAVHAAWYLCVVMYAFVVNNSSLRAVKPHGEAIDPSCAIV